MEAQGVVVAAMTDPTNAGPFRAGDPIPLTAAELRAAGIPDGAVVTAEMVNRIRAERAEPTDDLITWLRAVLDAQAAALIRKRDGHEGPCINYEGQDPADRDEYDSCARHIAVAEATPYRDVAFGLAEVDAKRRILDWLADDAGFNLPATKTQAMSQEEWYRVTLARATIKLLALSSADRPGYRDEWRPS